jgi:hypothetical protein
MLRRLEGDRRTRLLARCIDRAPDDVLVHHTRSLCLVQPDQLWARFSLDRYSSKYEARIGFILPADQGQPWATSRRGAPVTDLQWQALGRSWLGSKSRSLSLDHDALLERLGAEIVYLAIGLSRAYKGDYWPLVIGVHTVPDLMDVADFDPVER